jgi:acetyltransferase
MRDYRGDAEQAVELGRDRFVLRPIRDEDRRAYADFVGRIDASDLRRRFFHPNGLSPEIDFGRAAIDPDREVVFVAVRQPREGAEEIVGEARAYRYPGAPTAELAIIVRSDMQGRGLGRALMQKVVEYCTHYGLEMIAQILPDNDTMIRLAKRCGMQVEHRPGSDVAIAHMRPAGWREVRARAT